MVRAVRSRVGVFVGTGMGGTVSMDGGYKTLYGHMSSFVVQTGQTVTKGQLIGYVGTTGLSTGCHLHLQVYLNGGVVNPMRYIP